MGLTYDAAGNATSTTLSSSSDTSYKSMSTSAVYSGKRYMTAKTDAAGVTTSYTYDVNKRLSMTTVPVSETAGLCAESGTAPSSVNMHYQYDDAGRNTLTYLSGKIALAYSYVNGQVGTITRTGYNDSTQVVQQYVFSHDAWGNTTSTKAGAQTLASYSFAAKNGNMTAMNYGNNESVSYTYDYLDRVKTVSYNNVLRYTYYYNGDGALSRMEDAQSGSVVYYEYDGIGRLISERKYHIVNGVSEYTEGERYTYDEYNRTKKVISSAGSNAETAIYDYNNADGTLTTLYSAIERFDYSYDPLKRLSGKDMLHHADPAHTLKTTYAYADKPGNSAYTTQRVSELKYTVGTSAAYRTKYNYEYDNAGNIKRVTTGGGDNAVTYFYDKQNQLVMECNAYANQTYYYTYDGYGNIRSKKTYNYADYDNYEQLSITAPNTLLSTVNYGYTDANMRDKLTSYNGNTLDYDSIGNPTMYFGACNMDMEWSDGRKLTHAETVSKSIDYAYNDNGLRTTKDVDGVVHTYYYAGGVLASEKWGTRSLTFLYDESGSAYGIRYKYGSAAEVTYYYIRNLQGDVVELVNTNMATVARYAYDAWGRLIYIKNASGTTITSSTHIGMINPIRYRGYYYDTETGFYSLQSRYYDPEIGRFINADDTDTLLCSPNELTDKNLFAYCDNNPVMRVDHGGDFWMLIGAAVGAVVGGAVSAISQYASTGKVNWGVVAVNAGAGAISGALASTGVGLVASVGINAALGGGTYVAEQAIKGEKVTVGGVVASTVAGGIGGAIGGRGANAKGLSAAWKSASKGISRELRRANVKYATKQIAKYTAEKVAVKTSTKIAIGRLTFGAIGNAFARWKFGY